MDGDPKISICYSVGLVSACASSNMHRVPNAIHAYTSIDAMCYNSILHIFDHELLHPKCSVSFFLLALSVGSEFVLCMARWVTWNARISCFIMIVGVKLASTVILHFSDLFRFLITAHATERAPVQTWSNGFILAILIVAKLPEMQGVRLFGMNKWNVILYHLHMSSRTYFGALFTSSSTNPLLCVVMISFWAFH